MNVAKAAPSFGPSHGDKLAFLFGLVLYILGQVLVNLGPDFVSAQRPVDYAHWLLLLGSLFFLPFVARLARTPLNLVALITMALGVAAVIGMCVLDFIFWSLPDDAFESELARRLTATPAIWSPFITVGPNYIFGLALALSSLAFFRESRVGTALALAGSVVIALLTQWGNVVGYLLVLVGYVMNFRLAGLRRPSAQLTSD